MDQSEEDRALERGAPANAAELVLGAGDMPYLGDPTVADGVIREMLTAGLDAYKAGNPEQAVNEAKKVAAIFLGENAAFEPNAWFSPDGLGRYLARSHGNGADAHGATTAYLSGLILQMAEIASAWDGNQLAPDDAKFQIDALVDDGVSTLLGIPVDAT